MQTTLDRFQDRQQLLLNRADSLRTVLEARHHRSLLELLEETVGKLTGSRFWKGWRRCFRKRCPRANC